jgi:hypothetical protein
VLLSVVAGCGQSVQETFDLTYLTYGRPDYPYGSLVRVRHVPGEGFAVRGQVELAREAVLLIPGPYRPGHFPYVTVIGSDDDISSVFWEWPLDTEAGPIYRFTLAGRAALLWSQRPDLEAAVVLYVPGASAQLRAREFGREALSLRANARCSVAVLRFDQPETLQTLAACSYARVDWLDNRRIGFISRTGSMIALDIEAMTADTLARGVEAFSLAPQVGTMALSHTGDSITVISAGGTQMGGAIGGASVPCLSPNGAYLAYHTTDRSVWIRRLETGDAREVGVGYPVGWSADSRVLLLFERRVGERNVRHTLFSVATPGGERVSLPAEGFAVDAVLGP